MEGKAISKLKLNEVSLFCISFDKIEKKYFKGPVLFKMHGNAATQQLSINLQLFICFSNYTLLNNTAER